MMAKKKDRAREKRSSAQLWAILRAAVLKGTFNTNKK